MIWLLLPSDLIQPHLSALSDFLTLIGHTNLLTLPKTYWACSHLRASASTSLTLSLSLSEMLSPVSVDLFYFLYLPLHSFC